MVWVLVLSTSRYPELLFIEKFVVCADESSWLRNSVRMTKVEAVGGSTKDLVTYLE